MLAAAERSVFALANTLSPTHPSILQLSKTNKLGWNLLSFSVDSPQDLLAMRKALGQVVEYAEADLTGVCVCAGLGRSFACACMCRTACQCQ